MQLQSFIGLSPIDGLQHYGSAARRAYGDPTGVHQHQAAQVDSIEKYLRRAATRATDWRLMDDYRRHLGRDLLQRLGYDDDTLKRQLDAVKPMGTALAPTLSSQICPRPAEPRRSVIRLRRMAADTFTKLGKAG